MPVEQPMAEIGLPAICEVVLLRQQFNMTLQFTHNQILFIRSKENFQVGHKFNSTSAPSLLMFGEERRSSAGPSPSYADLLKVRLLSVVGACHKCSSFCSPPTLAELS